MSISIFNRLLLTRIISLPLLAVIFSLSLSACSVMSAINPFSSEEPEDTLVDITIKADGNINPDFNGRASPVKLRIYQLKSSEVFDNADFFALEAKDEETLGGDLLKRTDVTMTPDGQDSIAGIVLEKETCCIGVFAAYRNVEDATWRQTIKLAPLSYTGIQLSVGRLALSKNVIELERP